MENKKIEKIDKIGLKIKKTDKPLAERTKYYNRRRRLNFIHVVHKKCNLLLRHFKEEEINSM